MSHLQRIRSFAVTLRERSALDRGTLLVMGLLGYILLFIAWQVTTGMRANWSVSIAAVAPAPVTLAVVLVAWRASRREGGAAEFATAWRLLALAYTFDFVGDLVWALYTIVLGEPPSLSWAADAIYLGYYPVALMALFTLGGRARTSTHRALFWMDSLSVLLVSGMFTWFFLLGPVAWASHASLLEAMLSAYFPVGSALLLFAALAAAIRSWRTPERAPLVWLVGGLLLITAGDLAYGYLGLQDLYTSGDVPDLLWMFSDLLIIVAATTYSRGGRSLPSEGEPELGFCLGTAALPLVAVSTCCVVLAYALRGMENPLRYMVYGASAVALLAVFRQMVILLENRALLGQSRGLAGELQASEARFRSLVQHSSDMILVLSATAEIVYASPSTEEMLGEAPERLISRRLPDVIHMEDRRFAEAVLRRLLQEPGASRQIEVRLLDSAGEVRYVEVVLSNLLQEQSVEGIALNVRDITERKVLEARLQYQAFHDQLTGLANRALFISRVEEALRRCDETATPAVLYLRLDGYRAITDSLGSDSGDALVVQAANLLKESLGPEETLARFGANHFAVLLPEASTARAIAVAERLWSTVEGEAEIRSTEIGIRAVIGVAAQCRGIYSADELVQNAAVAMRVATEGKRPFVLFEASMRTAIRERLQMEVDLARGIAEGELRLLYQPFIDLETGRIVGVEALVRWQHPDRGLITPAKFIPLAEETGLIMPITLWVLQTACRQAAGWLKLVPHEPLSMNVNLSGHHLEMESLVGDVAAILAESGLPPHLLTLEITETVLVKAAPRAAGVLEALKRLGVGLAIDDFGTGYSSLGYLQRFPVDVVKIDRSFIEPLGQNPKQMALARGIFGLAHHLSLQTVAEGVERLDQVEVLRQMGCQVGQGYFWARPLEPAAVEALLQEGRPE